MTQKTILSIVESPNYPNFSTLYQQLNLAEVKTNSIRKAIASLKKQVPDFIVAEFFYGYGNNYAGINISNLDVLLYSLQKYGESSKVIVLVTKEEYKYVDNLNKIIKLHDVLKMKVSENKLKSSLQKN